MDNNLENKDSQSVSSFTRFFWWCSGEIMGILEKLPSEKNKYVGIGAAIFATGVLATLSGILAFNTVFNSLKLAIPLGIFYGMLIFNLDRFVTSSMKKPGSEEEEYLPFEKVWNNFYNQWLPAIPRILIAILIGITISKPLELELFRPEVEKELKVVEKQELKRIKKGIEDSYAQLQLKKEEVKDLKMEIAELEAETREVESAFVGEADGTTGTGLKGYEDVAKIKENRFNRIKTENDKKIDRKYEKIKRLEDDILLSNKKLETEKLAAEEKAKIHGFLDKIKALSSLINLEENHAMKATNYLIVFLIILIETAPVFVKLISSRGPYDAELQFVNKKRMLMLDRKYRELKFGGK